MTTIQYSHMPTNAADAVFQVTCEEKTTLYRRTNFEGINGNVAIDKDQFYVSSLERTLGATRDPMELISMLNVEINQLNDDGAMNLAERLSMFRLTKVQGINDLELIGEYVRLVVQTNTAATMTTTSYTVRNMTN